MLGKAFYGQDMKFPTKKNYLQTLIIRTLKILDSTQANNPMLFVPYLEPFLGTFFDSLKDLSAHSFRILYEGIPVLFIPIFRYF